MSQLQISDKTLNISFIENRYEILVGEVLSFTNLEQGKKLRVIQSKKLDQVQGIKFVTWKMKILRYIMSHSRKVLQKKFDDMFKKMCIECQNSLKEGQIKCSKDYHDFIFCEYLKRSLA